MDGFDPAPDTDTQWRDGADTFDRIYDVVLGITEPTAYPDIADVADCSATAAKKHLDRLAEMGVVRADTESRPARYVRDEGYLEWQEARRLARDLTVEEIIERVEELEAERATYEERFGTTDPARVDVFEQDAHETVHDAMATVGDWQATIRDLRLYDLARQLAQNDGHLINA
ncbi:DUF7342 family protein [Halarchaeum sp. P4]|uniref:DUF7342 family protein n=1 Tax=Halarchaeum sp. P4 TaxID=3421639 RepID=UPI003EBFBAE8